MSFNQNQIINVDISSFLNRKGTMFMVDASEDIIDMFVHCSHSEKLYFYSRSREFIVIVQLHSMRSEAIKTFMGGEWVCDSGSSIIGKFSKR